MTLVRFVWAENRWSVYNQVYK